MNKEETQKKIASVFKKYDYYITDLINSENINTYGNWKGNDEKNNKNVYEFYKMLLDHLLSP